MISVTSYVDLTMSVCIYVNQSFLFWDIYMKICTRAFSPRSCSFVVIQLTDQTWNTFLFAKKYAADYPRHRYNLRVNCSNWTTIAYSCHSHLPSKLEERSFCTLLCYKKCTLGFYSLCATEVNFYIIFSIFRQRFCRKNKAQ